MTSEAIIAAMHNGTMTLRQFNETRMQVSNQQNWGAASYNRWQPRPGAGGGRGRGYGYPPRERERSPELQPETPAQKQLREKREREAKLRRDAEKKKDLERQLSGIADIRQMFKTGKMVPQFVDKKVLPSLNMTPKVSLTSTAQQSPPPTPSQMAEEKEKHSGGFAVLEVDDELVRAPDDSDPVFAKLSAAEKRVARRMFEMRDTIRYDCANQKECRNVEHKHWEDDSVLGLLWHSRAKEDYRDAHVQYSCNVPVDPFFEHLFPLAEFVSGYEKGADENRRSDSFHQMSVARVFTSAMMRLRASYHTALANARATKQRDIAEINRRYEPKILSATAMHYDKLVADHVDARDRELEDVRGRFVKQCDALNVHLASEINKTIASFESRQKFGLPAVALNRALCDVVRLESGFRRDDRFFFALFTDVASGRVENLETEKRLCAAKQQQAPDLIVRNGDNKKRAHDNEYGGGDDEDDEDGELLGVKPSAEFLAIVQNGKYETQAEREAKRLRREKEEEKETAEFLIKDTERLQKLYGEPVADVPPPPPPPPPPPMTNAEEIAAAAAVQPDELTAALLAKETPLKIREQKYKRHWSKRLVAPSGLIEYSAPCESQFAVPDGAHACSAIAAVAATRLTIAHLNQDGTEPDKHIILRMFWCPVIDSGVAVWKAWHYKRSRQARSLECEMDKLAQVNGNSAEIERLHTELIGLSSTFMHAAEVFAGDSRLQAAFTKYDLQKEEVGGYLYGQSKIGDTVHGDSAAKSTPTLEEALAAADAKTNTYGATITVADSTIAIARQGEVYYLFDSHGFVWDDEKRTESVLMRFAERDDLPRMIRDLFPERPEAGVLTTTTTQQLSRNAYAAFFIYAGLMKPPPPQPPVPV
jgi:hypothetical protein